MKILNFGSCNIDFVYAVEHMVREGETISAKGLQQFPGGKGLNQSIALAKAGAKVFHAGCIGNDGIFLKELMNDSGVNTEYVQVLQGKTGHAIIQVDNNGENSIVLYEGTNGMIEKRYVDEVLSKFDEGDYLLLQNEINDISYITESASQKGMKVILNPSPYNEKISSVDLSKLSWIILNEVESREITGKENAIKSLEDLRSKYPNLNVVITLGKRGCIYTEEDKIEQQNAFPVNAIDTTGAGDTFTGYFFSGIAAGKSRKDSAYQASLASALSTLKLGAAVSIPVMKEVLEARTAIADNTTGGKK